MKMIKSELLLCMALTAFVFVCALAWGSPFVAIGSVLATSHVRQPMQPSVFSGTVLRYGEQFLLRESSGQTFRLDDLEHAQTLEGRKVTITGILNAHDHMIHVVRIEAAA